MKKIAIVGQSASGKTTLANKLGTLLHIPVYHLDKLFWVKEGGIKQDVFMAEHEKIMKNDSWIIEGHFWRSKTFDLRLEKADTIIFFDFPRRIIYWQLFKRLFKHYGENRPDMPEGHKDRLQWNLIKYIWATSSKEALSKALTFAETKEVIVLKNQKDVRDYLGKVTKQNLSSR